MIETIKLTKLNTKTVPDINGYFIYMWIRENELLYIGSTTQLHIRLLHHHTVKNLFVDGDIIYVFKLLIENKNILKLTEKVLIETLGPLHNIQHNTWLNNYHCTVTQEINYTGLLWRAIDMARTKNIKLVENNLKRFGIKIDEAKNSLLFGKQGFHVTFKDDAFANEYINKLKTTLYSWLHILNVNHEYSIKVINTTVIVKRKDTPIEVEFGCFSETKLLDITNK